MLPTLSRHFEYLISFQNFFNCLIFSYHYYQIICLLADMQLYILLKIIEGPILILTLMHFV